MRVLGNKKVIGMVAEHNDVVVAFVIYELFEHRLHLLNFAVGARHRRHGVGAQVIDRLISKLSVHRRQRITLEVRETNLAAQLFFRRQGFRAVSILRDFLQYRLPLNQECQGR